MTEPALIRRQRETIRTLAKLAAERAKLEPLLAGTRQQQRAAEDAEAQQVLQELTQRCQAEREVADRELAEAEAAAKVAYVTERTAAAAEYRAARDAWRETAQADRKATVAGFSETRWTMSAFLDGKRSTAEEKLHGQGREMEVFTKQIEGLRNQAKQQLERWKQPLSFLEPIPATEGPQRKIGTYLAIANKNLEKLRKLIVPRLLQPGWYLSLTVVFWLLLVYPLGLAIQRLPSLGALRLTEGSQQLLVSGLVAGGVLAVVAAGVARIFLGAMARRQVKEVGGLLGRALLNAETRCQEMMRDFTKKCERTVRKATRKHRQDLKAAHTKAKNRISEIKKRVRQARPVAQERLRSRAEASKKQRDAELLAAEKRHAQLCAEMQQRLETETRAIQARRKQRLEKIESGHAAEWQALARRWKEATAAAIALATEEARVSARLFPAWNLPYWKEWSPAQPLTLLEQAAAAAAASAGTANGAEHGPGVPEVLRFGDFGVGISELPTGVTEEELQRKCAQKLLKFPAFRPFPDQCSLLFLAEGAARAHAVAAVQGAMYRLLTAVPPGKVKFTILDPAGLGQNFASFMDLADYEESLVNARIWTESAHIEQRLEDLTLHIETVIQTYLRNRYANIMEYNVEAGEVAEPFRVVVVANFPVNFNEEAARRLVQISRNGPRCGVFTLVTVDTKKPLPAGFDLADLESAALVIEWRDGRFRWRDPDFKACPLGVEPGPPEEVVPQLLERIGIAAKAASRVEVPFGFVVPPPPQWWTSDSRSILRVPIGKAGALRRQYLELGKGTSQHVLIAGKTGSGKSSLLNALVTNLALHYSPDEVELYLIDFKKGVEFKSYAQHTLAHARVVAIESEREFGLSVLQRLDAELITRGEMFRQANVQDLASYRNLGNKLPRILLVVDEFQEFFTEDDRLARDASQMLDRLVRQGRAFGLHVMLGSQTLGGAYSLARSTIDQMGVRIALQLSEADAHLTLSADNGAARLLTRPGEAIYNDANGLVEGNNRFQVVWLPDSEREEYLKKIRVRAGDNARVPAVFEGNAPATVEGNFAIAQWLNGAPLHADIPHAWLGEAMALTAHTAAVFRRQNGSNLVVLGQNDETVLGMLPTALVSLAAQLPANEGADMPSFFLLDCTQAEAGTQGTWPAVVAALGSRARFGGWRQAIAFLTQLTEELTRREQAADTGAPTVFFLIYGLHRCRDLRRPDDDFGFSRGDAPLTPPQLLANLLREGPTLGLHTLIWCDTLANLQRSLDRTALRELSLRVALQMNAADSSTLLDSPVAGKLGAHRGLLYNEEDGRMEKFRPYALPTEEWLDRVKARLQSAEPLAVAP